MPAQPTSRPRPRRSAARLGPAPPPFAPDDKTTGLFLTQAHRETSDLLDTTAALRGVLVLTSSPSPDQSSLLKNWFATWPQTPAQNVNTPAQSAKISQQSTPIILQKSLVIISTRNPQRG